MIRAAARYPDPGGGIPLFGLYPASVPATSAFASS